jgi:hypothetical protein
LPKVGYTVKEILMDKKNQARPRLNAGTGMAAGALIGGAAAAVINSLTGDSSIWSWAIPVGIAIGLAVGAGSQNRSNGA